MKYVWLMYLQVLFLVGANSGRILWVDKQIEKCYNKLEKLNIPIQN